MIYPYICSAFPPSGGKVREAAHILFKAKVEDPKCQSNTEGLSD